MHVVVIRRCVSILFGCLGLIRTACVEFVRPKQKHSETVKIVLKFCTNVE